MLKRWWERWPGRLQHEQSALEEAAGLEERQAEPFSDYYPYEPGAILLVDSSWNIGTTIDEGKLAIGIHGPLQPLVRGAVLEVRDMKGNTLAKADETFRELYVNTIPGIWVRSKT